MHRLLVESAELESAAPVLPPEARRHLRVLRPKDGELVELFDGRGRWRVFSYGADGVMRPASGLGFLPRRESSITLFACVTKGSRWDWTVEKATELGVAQIVPVLSERTIVRLAADEREAKRERWQRVAEDAARQSDAKWIPTVRAPIAFSETISLVRETTCFVGALTSPPPPTIGHALVASGLLSGAAMEPRSAPLRLAVFIGPEGDFSPAELAALLKVATPVSFGATVLRAETAAVYAVSVLKALLDVQAG